MWNLENGTDKPISRGRSRDTDVESRRVDTVGEGESGTSREIGVDTHTHATVYKTAHGNLL